MTLESATPQEALQLARPRQRDPLDAFNGAISYPLAHSWLDKCLTTHSRSCNRDYASQQKRLAIDLIDVATRTLVHRTSIERYVALSYVWGKGAELRLKTSKDSFAHLGTGSDQKLPARIPQTLEDAITFTKWLDERYLWVDLYCIDQTDERRMQAQISRMDRVFSSAFVTLVNLDGGNADWGMPGISRPLLQTAQPTVKTSEGTLMATFLYSTWDNNGTSAWMLELGPCKSVCCHLVR